MKLKIDFFSRCLMLVIFALGLSNFAMAQRTVTGTVLDEDGIALIGANVLVKGTTAGTVTDIDGNYSLNVPDGSTEIEISYTGYQTQTITLGASNTVDVTMSEGELLDEVVVIGYGTQKRTDVTGAISSISTKDFNVGVITNPDQLIQGKVAGVQVINNSGAPGGAATVRIRGISSIRSGNDPLYVVDGVPLDGRTAAPNIDSDIGAAPGTNPLTFLNTVDIQNISILKDASAAAIYGSRGANGVILITTKKGIPTEPSIDVNIGFGTSTLRNGYDVLDGDEYRAALQQYDLGTDADFGDNVDAFDEITRTGINQNYGVAFSGGNENGTYRLSLGYQEQEGIIKESTLEKFVASLRGDFKLLSNKKLTLDYNVIASQVNLEYAPVSTNAGFTGNLVGQALQWNPTRPLFSDNGINGFDFDKGSTTINPAALLAAYEDEGKTTNILATISPSYQLTENLKYRFTYSIFAGLGTREAEIARFINVQNVEDRGWAANANSRLVTQYLSHTLEYNKKLGENNLTALVGFDYQKFNNKGFGVIGRDFDEYGIDYNNYLQGSTTNTYLPFSFEDITDELQSVFGRINYSLGSQFTFTATVRADGSSKFGENNRYGVFPSFAGAWNIDQMDFAPAAFDVLKLRAGWGQTGNQDFESGASQARFAIGSGGGVTQTNAENPDLQWEVATTFNVGVDFAIGDYKLVGSVEYFNKTTSDLLFNSRLASPAPDFRRWINLDGEIVNQGVEIGLNAIVVEKGEFSFDLGANVAFISNEAKDLGRIEEVGGLFGQGISGATSQRFISGQPLYVWYTRDHLGIQDNGQSAFAGDGREENFYLGDPIPDVIAGLFLNFKYDKLSLNLAFNGAFGSTIYNNTLNSVIPIGNLGSRNIASSLLEGDVMEARSNAIKPSNRYIEDGDFIKLNNATLSYRIGDVGGLKNLSLSLTGQNLLVITDYSGFDPEINTVNENEAGIPSFGIEYIPYPTARTFLFGLSFSL